MTLTKHNLTPNFYLNKYLIFYYFVLMVIYFVGIINNLLLNILYNYFWTDCFI